MTNVIFAIVVLGVLGAVFGLVLAVASKIFEVKKDPREEAVLGCLIALMQWALSKSKK